MIQIRNVPVEFHRRLKARAAQEGRSMSDYILRVVGNALAVPSRQEMVERLRNLPTREYKTSAAELIRAERDTR